MVPSRDGGRTARRRRRRRGARRAVVLAVGLLAATTTIGGVQQTDARWTNSEYASTTVAAARVAPAVAGTCAGGLLVVTFTWSAPAGVTPAPTSYLIHVRDAAGTAVQTATRTPAQGLSYSSLALLGGGTPYTFDVAAIYANGWSSTPIVGDAVVYALGSTCAWRA